MNDLKALIREIPDFPKPGILYYDITTLIADPLGLRKTIDRFTWRFAGQRVDKVVAMESRGFLFGPSLAYSLHAGFVPVRKAGKLPATTVGESYALEYGEDRLEIHEDAVHEGERVLIIDDLLATGGTAAATVRLIESQGAEVAGLGFIVELEFLAGRGKLDGFQVESLITYSE
ncbi:MAG: adenine phosphoribosyltransferase [Acidobacteriota bacterium]